MMQPVCVQFCVSDSVLVGISFKITISRTCSRFLATAMQSCDGRWELRCSWCLALERHWHCVVSVTSGAAHCFRNKWWHRGHRLYFQVNNSWADTVGSFCLTQNSLHGVIEWFQVVVFFLNNLMPCKQVSANARELQLDGCRCCFLQSMAPSAVAVNKVTQ